MALRYPALVERMVLFNSPLPYDRERMAGMDSRPPREAADYFVRQGTDPDGLMDDLATPAQRRRYTPTFHTSRFWAHPGAFLGDAPAPASPFCPAAVHFPTDPPPPPPKP